MKRWGQVKGDVDYAAISRKVYLATDTVQLMRQSGLTPPETSFKKFKVWGKSSIRVNRTSISRASRSSAGHDFLRDWPDLGFPVPFSSLFGGNYWVPGKAEKRIPLFGKPMLDDVSDCTHYPVQIRG
jgi:hypothetical protein